jgi:hypothetical protein
MRHRRRASWALAIAVSVAVLVAPAIWNGFPLLQYDTGGYLEPWYEHVLSINRSIPYGLLLVSAASLDFWPTVVLQAALPVWVIALVLRVHGLGGRPWLLAGIVTVLGLLTTLPWLTTVLITDIFAGLGVLALYLLLLRGEALHRAERVALALLLAVSAATHSATMLVLIGLLVAAAVVSLYDRARIPSGRLAGATASLALATFMVMTANWLVAGHFGWTPGGIALSFGRMLQDGIVKAYLDDHCPDPALKLCPYRAALPHDADDFFWGEGIFDKLGRFDGLQDEMRRIALASLADYPALQIKSVTTETAKQLCLVDTGAGVVNWIWNTYGVIKTYVPDAVPAMEHARQQRTGISFDAINRLQRPVAYVTMTLLPFIAVAALRRRTTAAIGELAAMIALAILGNAAVFGIFATAHNRYGARLVWLAAFVLILAFTEIVSRRRQILN